MNREVFVIVDVGCIECGEDTSVYGIYDSRLAAQMAVRAHPMNKDDEPDRFDYFDGGQHSVEIHAYTAADTTGGEQ